MVNWLRATHADSWKGYSGWFLSIVVVLIGFGTLYGYRFWVSSRSIPQFSELEVAHSEYYDHRYVTRLKSTNFWRIRTLEENGKGLYEIPTTATERFEKVEELFSQCVAENSYITIYYADESLPCMRGDILQLEVGERIILDYQDIVQDLEKGREGLRSAPLLSIMIVLISLSIVGFVPFLKLIADISYKLGIISGYAEEWYVPEGKEGDEGYWVPYIPKEAKKLRRAPVTNINGTIKSQYQARIDEIYVNEEQRIKQGEVLFVIKIDGFCVSIASVSDGVINAVYVHKGSRLQEKESILSIINL